MNPREPFTPRRVGDSIAVCDAKGALVAAFPPSPTCGADAAGLTLSPLLLEFLRGVVAIDNDLEPITPASWAVFQGSCRRLCAMHDELGRALQGRRQ